MKNSGRKSYTPASLPSPCSTDILDLDEITAGESPREGAARDLDPATAARDSRYVLRLFIAGATVRSQAAVRHARALCAGELKGRSTLEVIDIYQQPALARANRIVATPTLLIALPLPVRRFIGRLTTIAEPAGRFDPVEKVRCAL